MPATRTRAPKSKGAASSKRLRPAAAAAPKTSLADVMKELEKAGTAQARKTYARHGAPEPMFGVSFATLGKMMRRIGVDHDLAMRLWDTGNYDARNLAYKVADPSRLTPPDLDRWTRETATRMCGMYVAMLAQESGRGPSMAGRWLASGEPKLRAAGWALVAQLAGRDEPTPDAWFAERLSEIQRTIHEVSDDERYAMNNAVIAIGGRSAALRKAALAAAKKIGKVEVDHGDTSCKTPEAAAYIEKMWAYSKAKGFPSPSAQERERETPRTRC
jgi:hypothetical protein